MSEEVSEKPDNFPSWKITDKAWKMNVWRTDKETTWCLTRYFSTPREAGMFRFLRSISSKKQHRMHVCWENDVVLLLSSRFCWTFCRPILFAKSNAPNLFRQLSSNTNVPNYNQTFWICYEKLEKTVFWGTMVQTCKESWNARKIQHPSMLHNGKWALEYWWFFSSFCAMIFSSPTDATIKETHILHSFHFLAALWVVDAYLVFLTCFLLLPIRLTSCLASNWKATKKFLIFFHGQKCH